MSTNPSPLKLSGRLGIQLYTMNAELNADLPGTLKSLHDIGYREVETASLHDLTPEQFRAELDKAGLACRSCHLSLDPHVPQAGSFFSNQSSLDDPPAVIRRMKALGATQAVAASFPFLQKLLQRPDVNELFADMERFGQVYGEIANALSAEDWVGIAHQLNDAAIALAPEGIRVSYHNHSTEFRKFANGQNALEVLLANSDPDLVSLELDVGWSVVAGVDPVEFLKRHHGRVTQLHLKDTGPVGAGADLHIAPTEVGQGIMPWTELMKAVRSSPIQHVYVEQEPPFPSSAMESVRIAHAFLEPLMARLDV